MLVLAILAFSTGASLQLVHASGAASFSALPWASGNLVSSKTLTIYGSSTVGPIASEEIDEGNFVAYFNGLISAGTITSPTLNAVSLQQQGSGTAIPALAESTGSADVGEMSRPPSDGEFGTVSMTHMQQYAIGVDSVAIVLSPDMTWFPTSLTTNQVASLFVDTTSGTSSGSASPVNSAQITWTGGVTNGTQVNQGTQGNTGTTALYATWDDFLSANGFYSAEAAAAAITGNPGNATINRAVRDPTSGTYDCFNNYFAVPNGYQFEYKAPEGYPTPGDTYYASPSSIANLTVALGSQELAPFTPCEENINIYDTVHAGSFGGQTGDYIGFISLGYLETYGGMIGLNIKYNTASPPSGKTTSPLIAYYGTSGTQGFPSGSSNLPTWGAAVQPTDPNVIYAYSGLKGVAATGAYEAWRWLWEVVPGPIIIAGATTANGGTSSGALMAAGMWISYMMADDTTIAATSTTPGSLASSIGSGNSNFVLDQNYIPLSRDDFTGGPVIDSNLVAPPTGYPLSTQTTSYPNGAVGPQDFFYFVTAYIHYWANGVYNPYADIFAQGTITGHSFLGFVADYIAYFTTYNPTS